MVETKSVAKPYTGTGPGSADGREPTSFPGLDMPEVDVDLDLDDTPPPLNTITPMQNKLTAINQELSDLYAQPQTPVPQVDEEGNPILDENGEPVLGPDPELAAAIAAKTKEQQAASAAALTEGQQNLLTTAIKTPQDLITPTTVAKIDPSTVGTEISSDLNKVPQYDAAGNPILDEAGNPVLGPSQANVATASKAGVPQYDAAGNPILDADGNPVLGAAQTDAPDDIETKKYTASTSIGDTTKALEGGEFIDGASLVEKAIESSKGFLKDAKYNKEKGTVTYLKPDMVPMGFREDGSPYPQTFSEVEVPIAEFAELTGISLDDYTTQVVVLKQ